MMAPLAAMMGRLIVDGVLGLEHRLGDESSHVLVNQAVEHRRALPPRAHQAPEAHLREML